MSCLTQTAHEPNSGVGQTIGFRRLLGWAFRPRNFMKKQAEGPRDRPCRAGVFACAFSAVEGGFSTLSPPAHALASRARRFASKPQRVRAAEYAIRPAGWPRSSRDNTKRTNAN